MLSRITEYTTSKQLLPEDRSRKDVTNIKSKAKKRLYFVRKLGQFKVDRILITLFYKTVIESVLSFCITC